MGSSSKFESIFVYDLYAVLIQMSVSFLNLRFIGPCIANMIPAASLANGGYRYWSDKYLTLYVQF
jgi:hypothetical protein